MRPVTFMSFSDCLTVSGGGGRPGEQLMKHEINSDVKSPGRGESFIAELCKICPLESLSFNSPGFRINKGN